MDILLKLHKVETLTRERIQEYFDNTFRKNDFSECVFIETLNILENKYNLSFNRQKENNKKMPNEKDVERIKKKYPIGTRIKLHKMDDKYAVPVGTCGTVDYIDSIGQIHMIWDNGRTLALIESEDCFEILEKPKENIDMEVKI